VGQRIGGTLKQHAQPIGGNYWARGGETVEVYPSF